MDTKKISPLYGESPASHNVTIQLTDTVGRGGLVFFSDYFKDYAKVEKARPMKKKKKKKKENGKGEWRKRAR